MKKAEKGKPQDSYELFAPRVWRIWFRMLACILSVLLILYAVPSTVYAEVIELAEGTLENYQSEKVDENETEANDQNQDTVFEVVDRREESVKHFRLSDGMYTAVQYGVPVHTLDQDGAWQDIDNTLAESGSEYSTPDAKIKFAKKITGSETLFALHDGNRKITMSLVGAEKKVAGQVTNTQTEFPEDATQLQKMMTLNKLSSQILYSDILDGVDLEYVVNSCNIKENIIVKERGETYSYTFEIKLNNLEAVLCEDGSVALFDPDTDELVYAIPKGYMFDADGEHSNAVTYSLSNGGNGKYTLTVSADAEWINREGRAFPVTIDPPINTTPNTTNMVDTYIDSDNPNSLYYNFSFLASGTGSGGQEFISFWKLAPLPSLPANSYIASAKFSLYCQSFRPHSTEISGQTLKLGLYRVTSDWTTSITWNQHQSNGTGAFSEASLIDYATLTSTLQGSYVSWDVTKLYRMWHDGTESNFGIALAQLDEVNTDALLSSSENTNNNIPRLVIDYRDMKGVESYWSGSSHSAGMAGNGFVNHATGNLVFSIPTVSTGDALFGFTPTLVYNSAIADKYNTNSDNPNVHYKVPLTGLGLKLNTNESIVERTYVDEQNQTKTLYIWADGDGTEHYFLPGSTTGEWKDEDGLGLTLTVGTSEYEIKDQNHNVRRFTNASEGTYLYPGGVLKHIEDQYGNKLRFNYNNRGQTTTIDIVPSGHSTDNAIQYLTFSYNTLNVLYSIENVVTGQVVTLKYRSSFSDTSSPSTTNAGPLAQVIYGYKSGSTVVDYATMSYTYICNSNNSNEEIYRLASAKDEKSGTEICYTYDGAGRVQYVYEQAGSTLGQKIQFTYGTGYTEVRTSGSDDALETDPILGPDDIIACDDIITRYSLDYQGRAVGAYSTNVGGTAMYGATYGEYNDSNETDEAKNSLKSSAVTNGVAVNYIQNGGFTHGTAGWTGISGDIALNTIYTPHEDVRLSVPVSASTEKSVYQHVLLPSGTYTLSARLSGNATNGATVKLRVEVMDNPDIAYEEQYPVLSQQTEQSLQTPTLTFTADAGNKGKEKYKVIISVTGNSASSGTIYVDNVMLENNIGAGEYNMLQYGGFDETTIDESTGLTASCVSQYWSTDNATAASYVLFSGLGGSKALKINGDVEAAQFVEQTVLINAGVPQAPRTFTVSGFAKGDHQVANEDAYFSLFIEIKYTDSPNKETLWYDFNKELENWQFVSGTFTTDDRRIVESITVSCAYANQPGTAYFDGISLIEETGNNSVRYAYNENGLLEFKYSPSFCEYYEYDGNNNLITVYDSEGNGCAYVYGANHALQSQTTFKYDTDENDLLSWYMSKDSDITEWDIPTFALSKTEYTISPYGLNAKTVSYAADGDKDTAIQKTGSPQLISMATYNFTTGSALFGKMLTSTDTSGNRTTYQYDTKGRLVYQANPDRSGLAYTYDALGRVTNVYPLVYTTYYAPDTQAEQATYTYNDDLSLQSIITATTTYTFAYDDFGNTTMIMAGDSVLVEYEYADNNGKLAKMIYGNGKDMTYSYDALDRVKEICYTDSSGNNQYYRYTYTATGLIHSVECTETGRMYGYRYDTRDQLLGSYELICTGTDAAGQPVYTNLLQNAYWYDDKDRIDTVQNLITYTSVSDVRQDLIQYGYTYDDGQDISDAAAGALSRFDIWGAGGARLHYEYSYDDLYRLAQRQAYIDDSDFYQDFYYQYYDKSTTDEVTTAQIKTVSSCLSTATDYLDIDYTFEYDSRGNITKITGSDGKVTQYAYDDMGQLIREDNPYLNKTYVYTYDNAGNRTSKKTYAYTTGTLGTATATQTLTYSTGAWGDQLTGTTYDAVGNPTTYNGFAMTWSGRQLMSMVKNGGQYSYSFTYNDEGIRISKTSQGVKHTYILEGTRIVGEQFGVHLLLYLYDESGSPIGLQYRKTSYAAGVFDTYYFEKNVFGDIVGIYTADGTKIGTYKYDAWGNCTRTAASGTTALQKQIFNTYNPFRYRGYYYDADTGLYYLQSRYYDPATGRFINADGVIAGVGSSIQGYNLFAYCFNNPVNMQDNDGAWPSWNDLQSGLTDAVDWVNNNIVQPVVDFVENVVEDFNNYDSNNQSEDVVFSSNYFSNYEGKLVIKTPFDASFSFGFIGLSVYQQNSDTLRHEYGHTIQMENMGMGRYIIDVAIPSMTINMLDRQDKLPYDYYSYPWEAEANQLGGSTLSQEGKTPLPQGGYTSYWDLIQLFFD